ncbi:hypothetical protein ACFLUF_02855 [Chloroflexota bacterium]
MNLKNRKGFAGMGAGQIATIISVIVVVGLIALSAFQHTTKAKALSVVGLCGATNRAFAHSEGSTSTWNPYNSPRICPTIKKIEGDSVVPTEAYVSKHSKDEEPEKMAAIHEMGDMLKDCWWMWIEGSDYNVFPKYLFIGGNDCHICHEFRIRNGAEFTYDELIDSLRQRVHTAYDISDNCGVMGGFLVNNKDRPELCNSEEGGWKISDPVSNCCIREEFNDECGNRGGKCLENPDPEEGYIKEYKNVWACPDPEINKCYVKEGEEYSKDYFTYLTEEHGPTGKEGTLKLEGDPPLKSNEEFKSGEIYAISFYSNDGDAAFLMMSSLDYAETTGPAYGTPCKSR